jgi:hypothetical protein
MIYWAGVFVTGFGIAFSSYPATALGVLMLACVVFRP